MAHNRQRVDKDTFKQIFRDHWEPFQQYQPRYQDRHVQAVIDKMLGCGTLEAGYTTYLCPHCLEEKRVAFSCKSSFCLSCCKVYVDEWVAHIGRTLYEGVSYRHTVLTMPDALHLEFYRDRSLLADLMQCGVAMLSDALSWFKKVKLEAGYVVVLETAGRSGHWNPHLHILMTSGGMTPQKRWQEVDYFPFEVLHKKWQYHLFTMVKHRVGTRAIRGKIDALWRKYPRGLVAYLEEGKVPAGGEGLAYYLAKYVVSPPISLRRILSYDDKPIADTTPYPLPAGSRLLQDLGFLAFTLPVEEILMNTKKPRGEELTLEQQRANQALHYRRLRIEHVNSSVTRCRVVKDRIRLWKEGVRDLVMDICCALHNFRVRLTPWQPVV